VTCSEFLKELTDYLDGVIDAPTRAELEEHLTWCRDCYVVCNTTQMTIQIYRNSELYELPDDLRSRLRSAILTKCENHKSDAPEATSEPEPSSDPRT
jgi:anti-sigma factor RsiW